VTPSWAIGDVAHPDLEEPPPLDEPPSLASQSEHGELEEPPSGSGCEQVDWTQTPGAL
jgi:hypothetical protein